MWVRAIEGSIVHFQSISFEHPCMRILHIAHFTDKDVCEILLRKQAMVLHKFNILRLRIEELGFNSAMEREDYPNAIILGHAVFDGYKLDHWYSSTPIVLTHTMAHLMLYISPFVCRKYLGHKNPILGLYYLRLTRVYVALRNWKKAEECAIIGTDITRINNGMNHPLFHDAMQLFNHCASEGKIELTAEKIL